MEKRRKNNLTQDAVNNEMLEVDHLKAWIDNTKDSIWSVNSEFKIIASNLAFKEKVNLNSEQTPNKASNALVSDLRLLTFYERAFSGESFTAIEWSGDPFNACLEVSFSPIRKYDNIIGVACSSRDVTILKKEEHRLKLLESVVTNAIDAVLITEACPLDEAGQKIVYVNDALLKMTGYSREEILGKTPRLLQGPKSDRLQLTHAIKCLAQSEPCEIEIVNYKKNGDEFWMHIAIVPIADSDGQASHFISIGRDVTERWKNIEAIKEQNEKLKNIAWVQSHEVRGPLARVKGLVNLWSYRSHSKEDLELLEYLKFSTDEMDDVIRKITNQAEGIDAFR